MKFFKEAEVGLPYSGYSTQHYARVGDPEPPRNFPSKSLPEVPVMSEQTKAELHPIQEIINKIHSGDPNIKSYSAGNVPVEDLVQDIRKQSPALINQR